MKAPIHSDAGVDYDSMWWWPFIVIIVMVLRKAIIKPEKRKEEKKKKKNLLLVKVWDMSQAVVAIVVVSVSVNVLISVITVVVVERCTKINFIKVQLWLVRMLCHHQPQTNNCLFVFITSPIYRTHSYISCIGQFF